MARVADIDESGPSGRGVRGHLQKSPSGEYRHGESPEKGRPKGTLCFGRAQPKAQRSRELIPEQAYC